MRKENRNGKEVIVYDDLEEVGKFNDFILVSPKELEAMSKEERKQLKFVYIVKKGKNK